MVIRAYKSSTQAAETGGSKIEAILGYIRKFLLKKKKVFSDHLDKQHVFAI